jgi:nitroreductase
MDFLDLVKKRFSVRAYDPKPVPEDAISVILEAARLAPTAANRQPLHLMVLHKGEKRPAMNGVYLRDWFRQAPVIIVVCAEPAKAWVRGDGKNYGDVDAAIMMDHITLCAADIGLGTCWIAAFDAAKVRAILDLPAGIEPVALTPLGYPAEAARAKIRKTLSELVHREKW